MRYKYKTIPLYEFCRAVDATVNHGSKEYRETDEIAIQQLYLDGYRLVRVTKSFAIFELFEVC